MTVSSIGNQIIHLGNGSTTQFNFPFSYANADTFEVFTTIGGVTVQINPNDFEVALNPLVAPNPTGIGATITYPISGAPLAVGDTITIQRNLPAVQMTSIANQSIIYPPVIEREFDYLTMIAQQAGTLLNRSFQVGFDDPIPALVPPVALRANQNAFFDALGNLVGGNFPLPGVFISAAMQPVVGAATTELARDLMGVTQAIADAINAKIATVLSAGDLKPTHKTVADPGWILWSDGTIGGPTSGSTIRQNLDVEPLFTLYYNNYPDGLCPLLTSTGVATTRAAQGTAATAFAAQCRMTLPRGPSRVLGIAGSGLGLSTRPLGLALGAETHTQSGAELCPHSHGIPVHDVPSGGSYQCASIAATSTHFTDPIGSGQPMDIMNPTTYVNIMIKL